MLFCQCYKWLLYISLLDYICENIVLQSLVDEFLYYDHLSFRQAAEIVRKF